MFLSSLLAAGLLLRAVTNAVPINTPTSARERAIALFGRLLTAKEQSMAQPYYNNVINGPARVATGGNAKGRNQAPVVCIFDSTPYQLLTEEITQNQAGEACFEAGMVWAGIDSPADVPGIADMLDNCGGSLAHIAYYQGVYPANQPDVCAYVSNDVLVDFMAAPNICLTASAMVLCSSVSVGTTTTTTTTIETSTIPETLTESLTITSSTTNYAFSTTSITITTESVRTLTSTTWSPVVVTLVSTFTITSTSVTSTITLTTTRLEASTTVITVDALRTITITETILPTCSGEHLDTCPCKPGKGGFVLVSNKLPYYQANCACESLGLEFANVTQHNIWDARKVLGECLDCKKSAWIGAWDAENGDECLALYADGNIAVPENCSYRRPVLCRVPRGHRHHGGRSESSSDESSSSSSDESSWQNKAALPLDNKNNRPCRNKPEPSCEHHHCNKPCESSSSSEDCGCPPPPCPPPCPPPPPPCPCDCAGWSSESCSSSSSWESCDECQTCCCNKLHSDGCINNSNVPKQALLKKLSTGTQKEPSKIIENVDQITATVCIQTLAEYAVLLNLDTKANQEISCIALNATLADLSEADLVNLNYLFAVCNLSDGAFYNAWDQLSGDPCGYLYLIPNIFGYARFIPEVADCLLPRAAICRYETPVSTTVSFGTLSPQTTSTTSVIVSTVSASVTLTTTTTDISFSNVVIDSTIIFPDVSTVLTNTRTTVTTRTSPSTTTTRTTLTENTTISVDTSVNGPQTTVFTGTVTAYTTSNTDTTTTTTTVTLIGKTA